MLFTALHRYLGEPAGPITEAMIDEAIARGVVETDDLDWKTFLPRQKELARSDMPKDIAAMANSGGGVLIYGVDEDEKTPTRRVHAGEVDENYERTLRRVAYSTITPPVTGIDVSSVGEEGARAVVVAVPASADGPHLLYRDQYFGAPVRNNSDTEWMKERQIESAYRTRFDVATDSVRQIQALYDEMRRAFAHAPGAVIIAVAHPRTASRRERRERREVAGVIQSGWWLSNYWTQGSLHILDAVNIYNPQPGFRRWVLPWTEKEPHLRSHVALHDDGSVTMAWVAGGQPSSTGDNDPANHVTTLSIEVFISDLLALVKSLAEEEPGGDVVVELGIERSGKMPILGVETFDRGRRGSPTGIFGDDYTRVDGVFNTSRTDEDFYADVRVFAQDAISQFGFHRLTRLIEPPLPPRR